MIIYAYCFAGDFNNRGYLVCCCFAGAFFLNKKIEKNMPIVLLVLFLKKKIIVYIKW